MQTKLIYFLWIFIAALSIESVCSGELSELWKLTSRNGVEKMLSDTFPSDTGAINAIGVETDGGVFSYTLIIKADGRMSYDCGPRHVRTASEIHRRCKALGPA
jgi:hypothetical protein